MSAPSGARIVIAGGGTGGHLFPGLALAEVLAARGAAVDFVGTAAGIEARVVPAAGYRLHRLSGQPVRGGGGRRAVLGVVAGVRGAAQGIGLLRRLAPRLVVGVGGYASVAAVVAARVLRLPIVLLEQNAVAGAANRFLGRLATGICVGFAEAASGFPAGRVLHTGNPVRRDVIAAGARAREPRPRLALSIFGGSQGAHRLNTTMIAAAGRPAFPAARIDITHQTGAADAPLVRDAYGSIGVPARVEAFIADVAAVYAATDLALSRAGAMTCAELMVAGVPAILVPYPFAADDHQRRNAEALVTAGAAELILERDLDPDRLAATIGGLASDPERRSRMASAARAAGRPDAAERVADECERLALADRVTLL